jgi:hypothetical protein
MNKLVRLPDRSIPARILPQVAEMDLQGFSKWDSEEFPEAEKIFLSQLELMKKTEVEEGRAIHKGGALHNIGMSLAFQGKTIEAIPWFLQAYIEDTLNAELGEEYEADRGAAFNVLRNYFGVRMNIIFEINKQSFSVKQESRWKNAMDPNDILKEVERSLDIKLSDIQKWVKVVPAKFLKKSPFGFPQPWEHRVFIGGAYRNRDSMLALYKIKDAVRRVDFRYVPVMGLDVYIEKEIHHHTLLLLHTCKWAIFEVTSSAGQLMEIERALDYENRMLILYKKENEDIPESVSSMIRTLPSERIVFKGYRDYDEIPGIIAKFLPPFEESGK